MSSAEAFVEQIQATVKKNAGFRKQKNDLLTGFSSLLANSGTSTLMIINVTVPVK